MLALFEYVLSQIGPAGFEGLSQGVLRGTLGLVLAGFIAIALHRKMSPASRHMVWTIGVAILLMVPLGMLAAPALRVLPDWSEPMRVEIVQTVVPPGPHFLAYKEYGYRSHALDEADQPGDWAPGATATYVAPPAPAPAKRPAPAAERPPAAAASPLPPIPDTKVAPATSAPSPQRVSGLAFPWGSLLFVLWLVGFVVCITPTIVGLVTMTLVRLRHKRVVDGPWHELMQSLRKQLGIRRPVSLIRSKAGAMPMTWGIFLPQVVLPEDSFGWSPARKRVVILHELAHVRRWDTLTQLLAQVTCALFWFNPLVWYAASRMRIERELACDDLVLRAGCRPSDYAEELLGIAVGRGYSGLSGTMGVPMARASKIQSRVRSILDLGRKPGAVTRLGLLTGIVTAAAVLVPALMLRAKSSTPAPDPAGWVSRLFITPPTPDTKPTQGAAKAVAKVSPSVPPVPALPAQASDLPSTGWVDPGASAPAPVTPPANPATPATPDPSLVAQIQRQLNTTFPRLDIQNQPLGATLEKLATDSGLTLEIDWDGLGATGISRDIPVRYLGQNVTCADVIQTLLTQVTQPGQKSNRPVLVMRETSAWIAPRYIALANNPPRLYSAKALLLAKNDQGKFIWTPQSVVDRVKQSGEPGDWDHPDFSSVTLSGDAITVRAPDPTQEQIRKILGAEAQSIRLAANPSLAKPTALPAGVSYQAVTDTYSTDPAQTLVLNNAYNWNEGNWLFNGMAVSARKFTEAAQDVWRFSMTDPQARQIWTRHITSPIIADRYPYMIVRYRTTGLAASGPFMFWVDDGAGPNMGGYAPLAIANFIADGNIREIKADLRLTPRTKSNNPGPLAGGIALGLSNAPGKRVDFDVLQIRYEADPKNPNPPITLDQSGLFKVVDENGQPIQGATVKAMADWQNLSTTPTTGPDGTARVHFARPPSIGEYFKTGRQDPTPGMVVQVSKEGYYTRFYRAKFPLASQSTLQLDPVAQAQGTVIDQDGKPVAGIGVMIEVHNAKSKLITQRSALTDEQGRWNTDGMPIGKDWHVDAVRALDTRYLNKEHLTREQIGKLSAKDLCAQETTISVAPGVTLAGRVLDKDGKPVYACAIECIYMSGPIRVSLEVTADIAGRYTISPVAPGEVRLVFRGSAHHPMTDVIYVSGDVTTQNYNATLTRAVPIKGRLVDRLGQGVKGAWVRVRVSQNAPASFDGRTDANGYFTYPNAPDKPCQMEFILEEGRPYYMVTMPPDTRVQTVHLYANYASIDPLSPVMRDTTHYPIQGLNPLASMRAAALEPLGRWEIRPKD